MESELEKKLSEIKSKKKKLVQDFTTKSVDAINLSEEINLTHLSLHDSNCTLKLKGSKKFKRKFEEEEEDV